MKFEIINTSISPAPILETKYEANPEGKMLGNVKVYQLDRIS